MRAIIAWDPTASARLRMARVSQVPGAHCALQQPTFSQRRSNATAAPGPGFVELPKCFDCVLLALSTASEGLVRLIELRAQLRDGSAQEFEFGALLVAQFDAPIPSLIGLSHQPVFAARRRAPARRVPACHAIRASGGTRRRAKRGPNRCAALRPPGARRSGAGSRASRPRRRPTPTAAPSRRRGGRGCGARVRPESGPGPRT
jgi:hypothetical protein